MKSRILAGIAASLFVLGIGLTTAAPAQARTSDTVTAAAATTSSKFWEWR